MRFDMTTMRLVASALAPVFALGLGLLGLLGLLVGCSAPQPSAAPSDSIPRFDVALTSLTRIGDSSTGIVLGDRLVLTAAHGGVFDDDVIVVGDHATYVEQIVGLHPAVLGRPEELIVGEELAAAEDWALVRLADDVTDPAPFGDERPARLVFGAEPLPGTTVTLVGWIRDRGARGAQGDGQDGHLDRAAPPQRRSVTGTIIPRPRNSAEGDEAIFIRTAHHDLRGFSGGPVLMRDEQGEYVVIGMTVIGWQPFLRRDHTILIALKITPEMVVPSVDGRRFVVLGRRDRTEAVDPEPE